MVSRTAWYNIFNYILMYIYVCIYVSDLACIGGVEGILALSFLLWWYYRPQTVMPHSKKKQSRNLNQHLWSNDVMFRGLSPDSLHLLVSHIPIFVCTCVLNHGLQIMVESRYPGCFTSFVTTSFNQILYGVF